MVRLHLKPTLGATRLDRLNALQLQALYGSKAETGLSARTVGIIHATAHKALKQAVRWTLVPRKVAEVATPPRQSRSEVTPLTREWARNLLGAARGDDLHALFALACTTGMRKSELTGLKWSDIDLDAGTLTVNRSVYDGRVGAPKTAAGRRTIRLSEMAVTTLKEHRLAAARKRISEWVFCSNAGTPLNAHTLHNRSRKPLLERAGLPRSVRFHDLRHTCTTLLLSRGVPVKVVSEMLGHASVSITLDTYSHVLPDMQHTAARTMEDILLREPADEV